MLDSCLLVSLSGVEGRFADAKWFDSAHHDPNPTYFMTLGVPLRVGLYASIFLPLSF